MVKCLTCNKQANFGKQLGCKPEYCKGCSPLGYEDIVNKRCIHDGCKKNPIYALKGTKKREYCTEHALDGYEDILNKKCKSCEKRASYGVAESKIAEYCTEHALDGYENVLTKKCVHDGCKKLASYGKNGTKKDEYCSEHSLPGYENVKSKRCAHPNCRKHPAYGAPGTKKPEFCQLHRPDTYEDVVSLHCAHSGCRKHPSYGVPGSKKPKFCRLHAPDTYEDEINKKCMYPGCRKRCNYGPPGSKIPEFCFAHKLADYENVSGKKCVYTDEANQGCRKPAYYGVPSYAPEYCATHKKPNHIREPKKATQADFKTCEFCLVKIHHQQHYCEGCKTYQTLGKTIKRHEKELVIKTLLQESNIPFTHDVQTPQGCSKYRPDFVLNHPEGSKIIIEVDENQHNRKTYSCECETTRMKQIYFDIGGANVLFVRYNPDKYKSQVVDLPLKRQEYLVKYLSNLLSQPVTTPLSVVYLYYDHFDKSNPELEIINPYT